MQHLPTIQQLWILAPGAGCSHLHRETLVEVALCSTHSIVQRAMGLQDCMQHCKARSQTTDNICLGLVQRPLGCFAYDTA